MGKKMYTIGSNFLNRCNKLSFISVLTFKGGQIVPTYILQCSLLHFLTVNRVQAYLFNIVLVIHERQIEKFVRLPKYRRKNGVIFSDVDVIHNIRVYVLCLQVPFTRNVAWSNSMTVNLNSVGIRPLSRTDDETSDDFSTTSDGYSRDV